ncbi:vicilin Car i 2.0101-like [Phoenix dactylifera]|uniref:Vicilin Car i 2.0101-like n=1 Tax=Phoenix dactylifera TaxID=42345 RepID=A0A8B9A5X0_PHODC|nr:vicilin Car i 2.0101-like [Phoenix dactylifera]
MTTKPRVFIPFLLVLSILLVSATLALSTTEDPERQIERCKQECRESRQGEQQERQCVRQCEEQEEKRQQGEETGKEGRKGEDPEKRLEECRRECREQAEGREQRECEKRCEEECKEHRGENKEEEKREEEKGEKRRGSDPFFFDEESFLHQVRTEHGHVRVLRNFLERSKLLLGVANYRVAILEANPNTFVLPSHWDAEALLFVARGNGLITRQCQDNKETQELRRGHIIRVRAGTIVSFVNKDRNEKLVIVMLFQTVATPGMLEAFVGAGGRNPESFYRSFSKPVLRAAFNTGVDKLERLFGRQKKGAMIEASQEQIRELSRRAGSEGLPRPFGESRRPFNLLDKRPSHSNRHGELREADGDDYPELRDLNIQVSHASINKGSMMSPNYNTEATTISIVVGGNGQVQIVRPRVSGQQEEGRGREEEEGRGREEEEGRGQQEGKEEEEQRQRGQRYQRVESEVSRGTTYIVPAGHPSVAVSSRNERLEVLCFEINAMNNRRTWLAGSNNILKQMDRMTKELAFDQPAREVDEVLNAPREEVFMAGPQERERESEGGEGRDGPLESILEFAGF